MAITEHQGVWSTLSTAHARSSGTRPLIREAALKLDERTGKVGHGGRSNDNVRYSFYTVKTAAFTTFRAAGARGVRLCSN